MAETIKQFHISDVLSVTTGRLVSSRHMEGIYEILNFLTGDKLFTHQLPRASRECEPWLRTQFPTLFPDNPKMAASIAELESMMKLDGGDRQAREKTTNDWVEIIRTQWELPEMLPVYAMGADMHTHIDPIEEAEAMMGNKNVIVVESE